MPQQQILNQQARTGRIVSPTVVMPAGIQTAALYVDPVNFTNPATEIDLRIERNDPVIGWTDVGAAHAIGGLAPPKGGGTPVAPSRVGVSGIPAWYLAGQTIRAVLQITGTVTCSATLEWLP